MNKMLLGIIFLSPFMQASQQESWNHLQALQEKLLYGFALEVSDDAESKMNAASDTTSSSSSSSGASSSSAQNTSAQVKTLKKEIAKLKELVIKYNKASSKHMPLLLNEIQKKVNEIATLIKYVSYCDRYRYAQIIYQSIAPLEIDWEWHNDLVRTVLTIIHRLMHDPLAELDLIVSVYHHSAIVAYFLKNNPSISQDHLVKACKKCLDPQGRKADYYYYASFAKILGYLNDYGFSQLKKMFESGIKIPIQFPTLTEILTKYFRPTEFLDFYALEFDNDSFAHFKDLLAWGLDVDEIIPDSQVLIRFSDFCRWEPNYYGFYLPNTDDKILNYYNCISLVCMLSRIERPEFNTWLNDFITTYFNNYYSDIIKYPPISRSKLSSLHSNLAALLKKKPIEIYESFSPPQQKDVYEILKQRYQRSPSYRNAVVAYTISTNKHPLKSFTGTYNRLMPRLPQALRSHILSFLHSDNEATTLKNECIGLQKLAKQRKNFDLEVELGQFHQALPVRQESRLASSNSSSSSSVPNLDETEDSDDDVDIDHASKKRRVEPSPIKSGKDPKDAKE